MASSNVCFNEGVNCTCTSPPPVLPPRPNFCTLTTTTTEPSTTPTPTAETTELTATGTEVNTASPSGNTTYDGDTTTMDTAATSLVTDVTIVSDATAFSTTTNTRNGSTTGTTAVMTTACSPNDTTCSIPNPSATPATAPIGLIVGCTCGAIIFIIIVGVGIWWFWKKGKLCFRSQDDAGKTGSQECLPGGEEKQVELVNIKKGTVILKPLNKPPQLPPLDDGPPPKPPIHNTAPGLTPVEGPKEEAGVSPSQTTEGRPGSATSKKSRRGSRSNKVSPTPEPETK